MQVTVSLNSASEVPAVSALGATGAFTNTYNPSNMVLTYTVTYSGLTGPATAGHLHFGDAKHKTAAPTLPFIMYRVRSAAPLAVLPRACRPTR